MSRSSAPAVQAVHVSKRFQRGERHDSLRDLIPALVRRARRPEGEAATLGKHDFWAVRDLSFEVEFGRALGIIGPNGAGKSTSLKLLTGILRPTEGEIRMRGRVASLIEVSAGFHQDLTGRENVYLQGAIMGMTRREVDRQLDSIVEFAGIEPFIDTPVKRYSSGMNARLGFAIAVHVQPDVLVIDEVLSVGDMSFQEKCIDRMKAFKRDGVAIVFVTHNMQAVGELCDEALVIKGHPRFVGNVGDAVACYLELAGGKAGGAEEGDGVRTAGVRVVGPDGEPVESVEPRSEVVLEVDLAFQQAMRELSFSFVVRRATDGLVVYDGNFGTEELGIGEIAAGAMVHLRFPHRVNLTRGQYTYDFGILDRREARHRLWARSSAGLRIDELRTWSGIADLDVRATASFGSTIAASATPAAPSLLEVPG